MKTKIFDFNGMPITYRPGTSDEIIISSVLLKDEEYPLPDVPMRIVADVGANIGVATIKMALKWPDATIYAYEPEPDNFQLLLTNCRALENVQIFPYGLGGETCNADLYPSEDGTNLGGFSLFGEGSDVSKSTEITVVKASAAIPFDRCAPDFMKIDCEGAEGGILEDLWRAHRVPNWIVGELHSRLSFDVLALIERTHEIATTKALGQRCFHFLAVEKETFRRASGQN